MKRTGLLLGVVVVLLSNGVVWIRSAANRAGSPVQTITLTERELPMLARDLDDSSVSLRLRWRARDSEAGPRSGTAVAPFDGPQLQEMSFDCRVPTDPAEARPPVFTTIYAAFDYRGGNEAGPTQLFLADASRSLASLRTKYPDPRRYLILRAVLRVVWEGGEDMETGSRRPYRWSGYLMQILPGAIHVPQPFARELNQLKPRSGEAPRYAVTLHYGRSLEPWVASVSLF